MHIPPEHYALAGPLWAKFEEALTIARTSGTTAEERINSLRGKVSPATLSSMHGMRMQRNKLQHSLDRPAEPLPNPRAWEKSCRDAISLLAPSLELPPRFDHSASSGFSPLVSIFLWGVGGYVVLTNPQLTEVFGVGLLGYFLYRTFGPGKS